MTSFFTAFLALFLIGALPTAFLAVKLLRGKDIRLYGSGNVGATNAFRVLGQWPGVVIFTIDFLKGFLPLLLLFSMSLETDVSPEVWIWLAAAPVLGHIFTPFLGFRGGKGIATGAGVLLAIQPILFFCASLVWVACFAATRIVSLSSIVCLLPLPLLAFFLKFPPNYLKVLLFLVFLLTWTHRANIQRLISGNEKRF